MDNKTEKIKNGKNFFARFMEKYNDDIPKSLQKRKYLFIFLMALPALAGFAVWYVLVNTNAIIMAFRDQATGAYSLVNFRRLFEDVTSGMSVILPALKNTIYFFLLYTVVMPIIVYFIAYFFYKKLTGGKIFRIILFVPTIVSGIVISTLFKNLVSPAGPLSYLLWKLNGNLLPDYLHREGSAVMVILLYCFWFGFTGNLLLFMGTMNRLPESVIESAKLDGANSMQELFYVITPMVWSTLSTIIILSLTGIFTASGPILLFTNGAYDTFTLSFWIFLQTKDGSLYNYPAAVGLTFTLLGLPIVFFVWWLLNKVQAAVEF
jgi:ABC-type sugar transport system permease subunit